MNLLRTIYTKTVKDTVRNFNWNEDFQLYRCSQCGWTCNAKPKGSIGTAHAHAEKHTGLLSIANTDKLDKYIHKIKITDFQEVKPENE